MSMDQGPRQSGDDSADPYLEWVFSGAHDIEYWVVRGGHLAPADSGDLERIAEWEREWNALPRLRQWEWEREREPVALHGVFVRLVAWCAGLGRRAVRTHPAVPGGTERIQTTTSASDGATGRRAADRMSRRAETGA